MYQFPFIVMYYSIIGIYHTLFIHSLVDRYWGYLLVWAVISKPAMNIHIHVFVWIHDLFVMGNDKFYALGCLGIEWLDYMTDLCLVF